MQLPDAGVGLPCGAVAIRDEADEALQVRVGVGWHGSFPAKSGHFTREFAHYLSLAMRPLQKKWPLPNLILIDGGIAQANAAKKVLLRAGLKMPILQPQYPRSDWDRCGGLPQTLSRNW